MRTRHHSLTSDHETAASPDAPEGAQTAPRTPSQRLQPIRQALVQSGFLTVAPMRRQRRMVVHPEPGGNR